MTKMHTVLTSNDFDFIIATLNNASLEIAEKCMIGLKLNSKGYNRPFNLAAQSPMHLFH
jgi:hypothetical protein